MGQPEAVAGPIALLLSAAACRTRTALAVHGGVWMGG
jgi:hypothetical protein